MSINVSKKEYGDYKLVSEMWCDGCTILTVRGESVNTYGCYDEMVRLAKENESLKEQLALGDDFLTLGE